MIAYRRLVETGLEPTGLPCLVPLFTHDAYQFHRKRAGARKVRRHLRRTPERVRLGLAGFFGTLAEFERHLVANLPDLDVVAEHIQKERQRAWRDARSPE